MRALLLALALALALAGMLSGCGRHPMAEDSPGWDCRTMGNHVCGTPAR